MSNLFPNVKYYDNVYDSLYNSDGAILLTEWNVLRSLTPLKVKQKMKGNIFMDARNIYNPEEWKNAGFIFSNLGRI